MGVFSGGVLSGQTGGSQTITGGSINGTPIGASAASTGSFTQLNSSTNLTAIGSGSSSNADAVTMPAIFSAGASPTNGNMYGIAITVSGKDELFIGINKNSSTNNIPSNSLYFSSYLNNSPLSFGRGNGNGQPSFRDIGITGAGSVLVGVPSVATNATDGWLYIPSNAGAPTGTPTAQTGQSPIYFDTTNNKIWFYNGTWKGVVVA